MKRKLEHEVPLSADAVALIRRLEAGRIGRFTVSGPPQRRAGHQLSGVGPRPTPDRAGGPAQRRHAARLQKFREIMDGRPRSPKRRGRAVPSSRDRQSHGRDRESGGTRFEKRRKVMDDWSDVLSGRDADNVVPMNGRDRVIRIAIPPSRLRRHRHDDAVGTVSFEWGPTSPLCAAWPNVVNRLRFLRAPGESYSDVILRLVAAGDGIEA